MFSCSNSKLNSVVFFNLAFDIPQLLVVKNMYSVRWGISVHTKILETLLLHTFCKTNELIAI